jgi:hypothetical protein
MAVVYCRVSRSRNCYCEQLVHIHPCLGFNSVHSDWTREIQKLEPSSLVGILVDILLLLLRGPAAGAYQVGWSVLKLDAFLNDVQYCSGTDGLYLHILGLFHKFACSSLLDRYRMCFQFS